MRQHRAYAVFLILVMAALMVVTVGLSIVTYFKGRSDANVTRLSARQQYAQVNGDKMIIGFDADSLAVADGKLTGNLTFLIPEVLRSEMVDQNGKPIYTGCDLVGGCQLVPADANKSIQIVMTASDAAGRPTADNVENITLNQLSGNTDSAIIPVTIPVTSFPNNYPDDSYTVGIYFGYQFPADINFTTKTFPQPDYEINGGNVAKNFDLTIGHNTIKGQENRDFVVTFKRPTASVIYIYVAALVPLILALIFLHLLFFSRHAESRRVEEYMEALIVTVVAVLPLRLVLVPAELTGLTRVDLVLGFGLFSIVAIAGVKYATEVWIGSTEDHHVSPANERRLEQEMGEPQPHPAPVAE